MATSILWKIRAVALYMIPDEYHHARLRGEVVEEESSSQYRQYCSTGRRVPIAALAAAKAPPGAGLETTGGCPGLVIVGRLAGGACLAGGVRATENLGRVELDRVGRLP
jgi:hypothetical protein